MILKTPLSSVKKQAVAIMLLLGLSCSGAAAQNISVPINYDNLSFREEPIAFSAGTFTFNVNGLIDQSAIYTPRNEEDLYNTRANFQLGIQRRLANSARISFEYFGSYDRLRRNVANERYTDNLALGISDQWGTLSAGNVTGSVRENTRRRRGVGNANLRLDDFLGGLDETGGFYSVRSNAYLFSFTADKEGRAESGLTFSRPIGQSLYRSSLRLRKGDISEGNVFNDDGQTYGATAVFSYGYTNWLLESQLAYEYLDADFLEERNRLFASFGAQIKLGLLSLSGDVHAGRLDGEQEFTSALGTRYDLARGASLNFGYNYTDIVDEDFHELIGSVRYEF